MLTLSETILSRPKPQALRLRGLGLLSLFIIVASVFSASCWLKTETAEIADADAAVELFFSSMKQKDWDTVFMMLSSTSLSVKDRNDFVDSSKTVELLSYTIEERTVVSADQVDYRVRLVFRVEGEDEPIQDEQVIYVKKEFHRVWRLSI